jgi:hypothetical protein
MIQKYGRALPVKLAQIARLEDEARGSAYFTSGWPDGAVNGLDFTTESGNAIMVMQDDLVDVTKNAAGAVRFAKLDFDPFRVAQRVAGWVQAEPLRASRHSVYEPELQHLLRARWVLIVVTDSVKSPELFGVGDRFSLGSVKAAAVLFEIDRGELLGGFKLLASSSEELPAAEGNERSALEEDLSFRFWEALKEGVARRFPGARMGPTLGYWSYGRSLTAEEPAPGPLLQQREGRIVRRRRARALRRRRWGEAS